MGVPVYTPINSVPQIPFAPHAIKNLCHFDSTHPNRCSPLSCCDFDLYVPDALLSTFSHVSSSFVYLFKKKVSLHPLNIVFVLGKKICN